MILAFCVAGENTDSPLDERFGRAAGFRIVDSEADGSGEYIVNSGANAPNSAGIGAVQLLADKGVEGLVAPHLGPKAEDARKRLSLRVWKQAEQPSFQAALEAWKKGELEEVTESSAPKGLYRA